MSSNFIPILPNIKGTARVIPQHDAYPPLTQEYEHMNQVPKVELVTSESYNKYLIVCVAVVLVVLVVAVAYMATKGGWGKKDNSDRQELRSHILANSHPPAPAPAPAPKSILKLGTDERAASRRGLGTTTVDNNPKNDETDNDNHNNPDNNENGYDNHNNHDNNECRNEDNVTSETHDDESDEEEYINLKSKKDKSIIDEVSALSAMVNNYIPKEEPDNYIPVPKYVREEALKCDDEDVRILTEDKVLVSQVSKLVGEYNNSQFNKWVNGKTMQKLLNSK